MLTYKKIHSIDNPPGSVETRVFIGGNYSLGSRIVDIKEAVADCDFVPIIVWDFGVPRGAERHSATEIIQICKYAIFEASTNAGYFFEMEDAKNLSLKCLCLWDAHQGDPSVSSMTTSHPVFLENNRPYKNTRGLSYEVMSFLRSLP